MDDRIARLEALMAGLLEDADLAVTARNRAPFRQSTAINTLSAWVQVTGNRTAHLGKLPTGAYVVRVSMQTTVAWNSSGTDTISVGTVATPLLITPAVNVAAVGWAYLTPTSVPPLTATAGYQADIIDDLIAVYAAGGTAPTTGKTLVVVEYTYVPKSP